MIAYFTILALPVALPLARRQVPSQSRIYGLASLAVLTLLLYPATFPGAGPRHLLPLLPVLADARRRLPISGLGPQFAVFPVLLVALTTAHSCLSAMAERRDWGKLADEAVALARNSPVQPAEIGYGETEPNYEIAQLAKAKLAFRGSPPRIDAQILMELNESGIDGLQRWLPYVSKCQVARWILPKNERPFAVGSYYPGPPPFDDKFRAAFFAHYRLVATSAHFAVWGCSHEPG